MSSFFESSWGIFRFFLWLMAPLAALWGAFMVLCFVWFLIFRYRDKMPLPELGQVKEKKRPMLLQLLIDVPRRYMLDRFQREPGYFDPKGIHMFCGEQGCG